MRIIKYTTEELNHKISDIFRKIEIFGAIDEDIYFEENTKNSWDGIYIYSDSQRYYFIISERGNVNDYKVTDSFFEISYWLLDFIATTLAFRYEFSTREGKKSRIEIAYRRILEILDAVGANYRKLGEVYIDDIIESKIKENDETDDWRYVRDYVFRTRSY